MVIPVFTRRQLETVVPSPEVLAVLSDWISQGRGVACYQVSDPGHSDRGLYRFYSYTTRPSAPIGIEHILIGVYPPASAAGR